jgi:hydrogenase expression/formation protein HypD
MKYVDEYRTADVAHHYAQALDRITTRSWTIMEICGGQTHAIVKFGIDQLLPQSITLIHGPGCPVCVTPIEFIDQACTIAALPNVIFCSFGDMLRVPGSHQDLLTVKALGGDVRMVYSPLDALKIAQSHPDQQVVFFAVGFETTAPATAIAVYQAKQQNIQNVSLLVAHVLVPPAIEVLLSSPDHKIDGFLAAGHVCAVMGYNDYEPITQKHHIPIVVTGFEPADILQGIYQCVQQLEAGQATVENQYTRAVQRSGNQSAQQLMQEVFTVVDRTWRGIGTINQSGLGLRDRYAEFDANLRFQGSELAIVPQPTDCISGLIPIFTQRLVMKKDMDSKREFSSPQPLKWRNN